MKGDGKFKCQTKANQQTDMTEDCPCLELNGQSLEITENFCYLGDTIRARGSAFDSAIIRIKSGQNKFRDFVLLLASRGLPLGAKGRLYSGCVGRVMLYGSETQPVKEEDMIKLEVNDARMFRWMCCDKMSCEELSAGVKLKSMSECSGHLQRMEESVWSSKCITFR